MKKLFLITFVSGSIILPIISILEAQEIELEPEPVVNFVHEDFAPLVEMVTASTTLTGTEAIKSANDVKLQKELLEEIRQMNWYLRDIREILLQK